MKRNHKKPTAKEGYNRSSSIELVVLGLLAALLVSMALPLLSRLL